MQRIFLFPLLLLLSAPLVGQTTWYVDQSGNGDFLTIQEGIDGHHTQERERACGY